MAGPHACLLRGGRAMPNLSGPCEGSELLRWFESCPAPDRVGPLGMWEDTWLRPSSTWARHSLRVFAIEWGYFAS